MKKILAVYCSKNKTAQMCCERIASEFEPNYITLCDLNANKPDISTFDILLIGGSIRMGQYPRKLKKWLKRNRDELLTKTTYYFLNCGFPENQYEYFSKNIDHELLIHAQDSFCFGGKLDLINLRGTDRMVALAVAKQSEGSGRPDVELKEQEIIKCADQLRQCLETN